MKMELIEGSETSAIRTQAPGNYPKENIMQSHYCLWSRASEVHLYPHNLFPQGVLLLSTHVLLDII